MLIISDLIKFCIPNTTIYCGIQKASSTVYFGGIQKASSTVSFGKNTYAWNWQEREPKKTRFSRDREHEDEMGGVYISKLKP